MKKTPAPHPLLDHPWVKPGLWLLAGAVALFFLWDDIDRRWLQGAIVSLLIFIVSVIVLIPRAKQRTKKFKQVAGQMGMKFSNGDSALLRRLGAFDLFRRVFRVHTGLTRLQKITNVLHGDSEQLGYSEEFKVTILECMDDEEEYQTVILFRSPRLSLPDFLMRPEKLRHKIGSRYLGDQDIDFESDQTAAEFSKKYLLRGKYGKYERKIRVLFTDKILTFFAAHPDEVCVEGRGKQLIFYQAGKIIEPEDTPAFIEEGLEVFRLFASSRPS